MIICILQEARNRPVGASVPALGLSNKAIFTDTIVDMTQDLEIKPGDNEQYADNVFTQVSLRSKFQSDYLYCFINVFTLYHTIVTFNDLEKEAF